MRTVTTDRRAHARGLSVVILLFNLVLAGCTVIQPPPDFSNHPSAADVAFDEIAKRYLAEMLPLMPVQATALGEHRYDATLDDVSAEGQTRRTGLARQLLAQLNTLQLAQLSRAHQVDLRLLKNELEYQIWRTEQLQEWRWNPLLYTDMTGNGLYLLL